MNEPELSGDQVAQAIYTWSRILIDGSRGIGFSALSPSLRNSVDWLSRLQMPEFNLFPSHIISTPTLYRARKGFSEVGRTVRGETGIIYCKTANGVVDPAGRQHPVIHALFAEASALGLLCLSRIRESFWIRQIANAPGGGLNLQDIVISDIYSTRGSITKHVCPRDHQAALDLLRLIAQRRIELEGDIEIPLGRNALEHVALAFPLDIADNFSLYPYLTDNDPRRELHVRVYSIRSMHAGGSDMRLADNSENCHLRRAVMSAAKRFLYVDEPSLRRYAEAVLDLDTSNSASGVRSWRRL